MIGWGDNMLYLFVEGPDDERLVRFLFSNISDKKIYPYANKKNHIIANLIKAINNTPGWQYIFFVDSDTKKAEERIKDVKNKWNAIDEGRIVVVCLEIESWYYAGMRKEFCERFKVRYQTDANTVCKEQFVSFIKKSRRSKSEVLIEAVNDFDLSLAGERNASFNSFFNKYLYNNKEEPINAV